MLPLPDLFYCGGKPPEVPTPLKKLGEDMKIFGGRFDILGEDLKIFGEEDFLVIPNFKDS